MTVRAVLQRLWRASIWSWSPATPRESSEAIVRNFWLHWFPAKVSLRSMSWSYSLWLGTITLCLFVILLVTGMLLMFFYVPSVEQAYWSVKDLTFAVSFGWLLRNQHRVAAHLMVATTFLHMSRVFWTGAYRGPRSANWLIGVLLLLVTLLLSFTGYLLPWDQLAFWAVTVGTNIAREAPVVGDSIRFLLLGGNQIGQPTLLRFYVLHVFVLPVFTIALVAIHLWRVRKDGGLAAIEPLRRERIAQPREASPSKSYSLFGLTPGTSLQVVSSTELEEADTTFAAPDLARRIALVFLAVFNATLVLALLFNAPLEEAANPIVTPNPAKAPWYFLWLQELVASTTIRVFGLTVSGGLIGGILLPAVLLVVLAAWPFLDRTAPSGEGVWFAKTRRRQNLVFGVVTLAIVALIAVGLFLRGPSWRLYWPWQSWPVAPKSL